jgi:serine/threonine-protein kinase
MAEPRPDPDRTIDESATKHPAAPAGGSPTEPTVNFAPGGTHEPADAPRQANDRTQVGPDADQGFTVDSLPAGASDAESVVSMHTQDFDPGKSARRQRRLENVKVPGYEIIAELGHGGMGVVYEARDTKLDRTVALKMVLSGIHASETQLARFVHEAKAVAHIQHVNIVQIYAIDEAEGVPFFSLEYVDGGSLDAKVDHKPQAPEFAAATIETLARAMQYAHDQGIIHRDLKPGNVLLTKDGTPKIADFGLAKRLDEAGVTQAGLVVGTPNYMAPEQARGDIAAVGPASDQFSLGAMLYELLTGRPPFNGATILLTLEQAQKQDPVPPSQLNPSTPRDLETICLKALQKDRAKRYGSCGELADDLGRFRRHEPIKARPVGYVERTLRWCRRNPVEASLIGLASMLLVSVAVASGIAAVMNRQLARRLDQNRGLTQVLVTEMPYQLECDIYVADETKQQMVSLAERIKGNTERDDDRHIEARKEQAVLMRRGAQALQQKKFDEAVAEFEKARKIAQGVVDDNPRDRDKSNGNLAAALVNLGEAYLAKNEAALGREYYAQALAIRRRIADQPQTGELPPSETHADLAAMLLRFAESLLRGGDPAGAINYATNAVEIYDQWGGSLRAADRYNHAVALSTLGQAKFRSGDLPAARADTDRARKVLQSLINDESVNLLYQRKLALIETLAAEFEFVEAKNTAHARELYEDSLKTRSRLASAPQILQLQKDVADSHYFLATAALRDGDRATANKHYRQCVTIRQFLRYAAHPNNIMPTIDLMLAQGRGGMDQEAATTAAELERLADANPKFKIRLLKNVAWAYGFCADAVTHAQPGTLPSELQQKRADYLKKAFAALTRAFDAGYREVDEMMKDPDFDPLRDDPRFTDLLTGMKNK